MKCRFTCSGCFSSMGGSLTITAIALAIQEMVASWRSTMVSHRSIKARIVDLVEAWVGSPATAATGSKYA